MRRPFNFFLIILVSLCASGTAFAQTSNEWTTFQHDFRHSGKSPYVGPTSPVATVIKDLTPGIPRSLSVGPGGVIYLAVYTAQNSRQATIFGLNPDGTIAKQTDIFFAFGGLSTVTIADDGTMFVGVGTDSGGSLRIYCFNSDASIRWFLDLIGRNMLEQGITLGPDGTVYVPAAGNSGPCVNNKLLALNQDGTVKWTFDYADGDCRTVTSSPAIMPNGNVALIGLKNVSSGQTPFVEVHNPDNGGLVWSFNLNAGALSDISVAPDGTIYAWSSPFLWALNPDGTVAWTSSNLVSRNNFRASPPVVYTDGSIGIVTSGDSTVQPTVPVRLWKFSSSGQLQWTADLSDHTEENLLNLSVDSRGNSYISLRAFTGATKPRIFAFNDAGAPLWTFPELLDDVSSAIVGAPDTLYASICDHTLGSLTCRVDAIGDLSGCTPPTITVQPQSQTIQIGNVAALTVTAEGSEPLNYQWYEGVAGDQTNPIVTGTASTLLTAPSDDTNYWVKVTNACEAINSNTAKVTVLKAVTKLVLDKRNRGSIPGARKPLVLIHGIHGNVPESRIVCLRDRDDNINKPYNDYFKNFQNYFFKSPLKDKYVLYRFHYVSDVFPVTEIGKALRNDLEVQFPNGADLVILAHSMGGLVARSFIQEWGGGVCDPGSVCVEKLLTLGTPHHGTIGASEPSRNQLASSADDRDVQFSWTSDFNKNWSGTLELVSIQYWKAQVHNTVNRADLRWDNFDGVFHDVAAIDINSWLADLNDPEKVPFYPSKIISYYGYVDPESSKYTSYVNGFILCDLFFCGPWNILIDSGINHTVCDNNNALFYLSILQNYGYFEDGNRPYPKNDGFVPIPSAAFDNHQGFVAKQVECKNFDHEHLRDGNGSKTCQNGFTLFDSIKQDLLDLAP